MIEGRRVLQEQRCGDCFLVQPDGVGDEEAPTAQRLLPQQGGAVAERVVDDDLEHRTGDVLGVVADIDEPICLAHQPHDGPASPRFAKRLALLLLQPQQARAEVVTFPPVVVQLAFEMAGRVRPYAHGRRLSTASRPVQSSGRL